MTGIVRESEHGGGVTEKIGALKSMVMSRFEPGPPSWQASAISIWLYPSGNSSNHNEIFCCWLSMAVSKQASSGQISPIR